MVVLEWLPIQRSCGQLPTLALEVPVGSQPRTLQHITSGWVPWLATADHVLKPGVASAPTRLPEIGLTTQNAKTLDALPLRERR